MRSLSRSYRLGNNTNLYTICLMIFFFGSFDSLFSYMIPLLMTQHNIDQVHIGYLIGSSSVAGILADVLMCHLLKNVSYRRIFLAMFLVASIYPFVLWGASTTLLFIAAMAIWGLYYDLLSIGQMNFISNNTKASNHSYAYALLKLSLGTASLIAVAVAGIMSQSHQGMIPYLGGLLLAIGFLFLITTRKTINKKVIREARAVTLHRQLGIWKSSISEKRGVLVGILLINIIDSAFWQLGPQIGQTSRYPLIVRSFFMVPYQVAPLVIGLVFGRLLRKRKTYYLANFSLAIACSALSVIFFTQETNVLIAANITASFFLGIAFPAYWGTYSLAIEKNHKIQSELETLGDAFTNTGYIVGPVLVGYLASEFGIVKSFGAIGLIGLTVCLINVPKAIILRYRT